MTSPFLIAHKVRGEPAFDIAERSPCMFCKGYETASGEFIEPTKTKEDCNYCIDGWTWSISSGGWRAHPFWNHPLDASLFRINALDFLTQMPEDWPDLFSVNDRKHVPLNLDEYGLPKTKKDREVGRNLLAKLGLFREKPKPEPIKRRI